MPRREPVAWVLNLDAEDELAHPGAHTPTAATTARVVTLLPRLAGLVAPHDVVVWPGGDARARGLEGRAWCPTRWALERLATAGARVPPAPSMAVLRRVTHRRFAFELGFHLPAGGFARDALELERLLADRAALAECSTSGWWLLKRPFGYAGRGRKKVRPDARTADERAWIDASLATGEGLLVEPLVARELDVGLHGQLAADGAVTLGQLTVQEVDDAGTWRATRLAAPGVLRADELDALTREAYAAAAALHAAGSFGPFGLDGYRWRTPTGEARFQPRSEVNARYSMGWATGFSG